MRQATRSTKAPPPTIPPTRVPVEPLAPEEMKKGSASAVSGPKGAGDGLGGGDVEGKAGGGGGGKMTVVGPTATETPGSRAVIAFEIVVLSARMSSTALLDTAPNVEMLAVAESAKRAEDVSVAP